MSSSVVVRYYYKGQRPFRGKLVDVPCGSVLCGVLPSSVLLQDVFPGVGVDTDRFCLFWYDMVLRGYRQLDDAGIPLERTAVATGAALEEDEEHSACLDIQLEEKSALASKVTQMRPKGFFGVGILRGRREESLSVLWRTAFQMGAAFVFTIECRHREIPGESELPEEMRQPRGFRNKVMESEDCQVAFRTIPLWRFTSWEHFFESAPFAAPIVALEMGGQPLETFAHPNCCLYLLGSEEDGIPKSILQTCPHVVEIPTERAKSFSIAAAGSIILYDRILKSRLPIMK